MRENIYGPENRVVSARMGKDIFVSASSTIVPDRKAIGYEGIAATSMDAGTIYKVVVALMKKNLHEAAVAYLDKYVFGKKVLVHGGAPHPGVGPGWLAGLSNFTVYLDAEGSPYILAVAYMGKDAITDAYLALDAGYFGVASFGSIARFLVRLPLREVCQMAQNSSRLRTVVREGEAVEFMGLTITYSRVAEEADISTYFWLIDEERRVALRVDITEGSGAFTLDIAPHAYRTHEIKAEALQSNNYETYVESGPLVFSTGYSATTYTTVSGYIEIEASGWWYFADVTYGVQGVDGWTPSLGYVARRRYPENAIDTVHGIAALTSMVVSTRPKEGDARYLTANFAVSAENVVDLVAAVGASSSLRQVCTVDPYIYMSEEAYYFPETLVTPSVEWVPSGRYSLCYIRHHRYLLKLLDSMAVEVLDQYRYTDYHIGRYSKRFGGYVPAPYTVEVEDGGTNEWPYRYHVNVAPRPSVIKYSLSGGRVFPVYELRFPSFYFAYLYNPYIPEVFIPIDYVPLQTDIDVLDYREYGGYALNGFYIYGNTYYQPAAYPDGVLGPVSTGVAGIQGRYRLDQVAYFNPSYISGSRTVAYRDMYAYRQRYLRGEVTVTTEGDMSYVHCADLVQLEEEANGRCAVPPLAPSEMGYYGSSSNQMTDTNKERIEQFVSCSIGADDTYALFPLHLLDVTAGVREAIFLVTQFGQYEVVAKCYYNRAAFLDKYAKQSNFDSNYASARSAGTSIFNGYASLLTSYENSVAGMSESMLAVHAWSRYKGYNVSTFPPTTALYGYSEGPAVYAALPSPSLRDTYQFGRVLAGREREAYEAIYSARSTIMETVPDGETVAEQTAREDRQWQRYRAVFMEQLPKLRHTLLDEIQNPDITAQAYTRQKTTVRFSV